MKGILLFVLTITFQPHLKAQKPVIDSFAIHHWVSLGDDNAVAISNDGLYVAYVIQNQPLYSNTVVVQDIAGTWKKEFPGALAGIFSKDSKQYVFISKDSLCFLPVGAEHPRIEKGVTAYQYPYLAKGEWITWYKRGELIAYNLLTGKQLRYPSVKDYLLTRNGKALLLKTAAGLDLVNLSSGELKHICNDTLVNNYTVDDSGTQIAFIISGELWYYKTGMDKAVLKAAGRQSGLIIEGQPSFSDNNRYIFFQLNPPAIPAPKPDAVKLDVWSYHDAILQSLQLYEPRPLTYDAVISTDNNRVIRLQFDDEISKMPPVSDYMLYGKNTAGDRFWLSQADSNWLVSLKDGSRKLLATNEGVLFRTSPDGNYLLYFDKKNYFSYDLRSGRLRNISASIPSGSLLIHDEYKRPVEEVPYPLEIAAWLPADTGVLVYDNYDIWQLDITGRKAPINITNGYGKAHHIKLKLAADGEYILLADSRSLLLAAYNTVNKQNGFYRTTGKDPVLLIMGPYVYDLWGRNMYAINDHDFDKGMKPLKAEHADVWVVKRQSTAEAPNYFTTSDFKNYTALTDLHPQTSYNWLTAELVSFKQLDGTVSQGVLYKPENFDPHKKYPVLFNYYEQMSHRLYQYPTPNFTRHNIDVAWFVSHGYLVFTPDIYFTAERTGKSALNTVAGGAIHLSKLPYIDAFRMGINGHSSGGFLTNYIITHTALFAAAIEGAGPSDMISSALQLSAGRSRLSSTDQAKGILWKHKDLWLEESPVMHADKVTTPLIIFHSKADSAVPWEQAVELFIALRRLNKKVWMLQYDKGNHGLWNSDCEDYTIRITQFFDHYLKGALPPVWMTQGIPARLKGVEMRYELDTSGKQP
ncbi:Dipeptidyl aminopeptidase/acylaminoacyl peptidase [Chitinophaga sp. YR573]|uniref:S9 family peptidase n=1 Tax=Chitinophaga sp. YR573 TaxID=1881040 RepID=UPI0008BF85ED|nr:prolyl oligopeptidase family serine peptidase [Chitinophaga sp. YR573]SEW39199.1 Dipeptidyl aminopeptidase/acylaminoacyl peptidase [Chitinophaga sp. YR573]